MKTVTTIGKEGKSKTKPANREANVEQQVVPQRHHAVENARGGGSHNSTETSLKSGAESKPDTRIAKPRNKTVSHVTRRKIYSTARDKGTSGEGRSDSGDQSQQVPRRGCTWRRLGETRLSSEGRSRKAPAKQSRAGSNEALHNRQKIPPPPPHTHTQGKENSGGPDIEGDTEISCRRQGYEIWLLLL